METTETSRLLAIAMANLEALIQAHGDGGWTHVQRSVLTETIAVLDELRGHDG